ncbi:MAG: DUF1833 family protein [Elusimicrobia bacterium]|nr:DUF1833 family protein [Elusimicrobiota bacterium]
MANRFFELDKNSFSRYLGRNVNLLIELSHSAWDKTFYLINDTQPLELDGSTYEPYPFDLTMPSQTEQQGTQIVLSNINNIAANLIKSTVNTNENILMRLYLVNRELETAEKFDKGEFEIFNPQITNESITATINLRHSFDINCGSIRYNRQLFPNLYL